MERSPSTLFGRATADAYDPSTHGDDPDAFFEQRLAEAPQPLDLREARAAYQVRLWFRASEPPPPADDRPSMVSGEIVVP